jgi:hypothetical protein
MGGSVVLLGMVDGLGGSLRKVVVVPADFPY